MKQWRRNAFTRVQFANVEMNKLPSHVSAGRGLDYGCPRYDEEIWQPSEPSTDEAAESSPNWNKAVEEKAEADVPTMISSGRSTAADEEKSFLVHLVESFNV